MVHRKELRWESWSRAAGWDIDETPEAPLELTKPVWSTATHFLKHQDPWALTELGAVISRRGQLRKSSPKQGLFFLTD